jgi:hypothetical protein
MAGILSSHVEVACTFGEGECTTQLLTSLHDLSLLPLATCTHVRSVCEPGWTKPMDGSSPCAPMACSGDVSAADAACPMTYPSSGMRKCLMSYKGCVQVPACARKDMHWWTTDDGSKVARCFEGCATVRDLIAETCVVSNYAPLTSTRLRCDCKPPH